MIFVGIIPTNRDIGYIEGKSVFPEAGICSENGVQRLGKTSRNVIWLHFSHLLVSECSFWKVVSGFIRYK